MRKPWLGLAAGIMVLAAGVPVQAFERLCKPHEFCVWEWADMPIPYTIDLASLAAHPIRPWPAIQYEPFDVAEIIHRAFRAWESIPGTYVRFQYEPHAALDLRRSRPLIQIFFSAESGPKVHLLSRGAKGALRFVRIEIPTSIGPITWSKYRFYKTMLHEIGHALGLDHPREYPAQGGPVMGYGYFPDGQWAEFDPDDLAGFRYLYPAPGVGRGQQVISRPDIGVWPESGPVRYQGEDFVITVSHSSGGDAIASVQVLVNSQDITPAAAWLFGLFGRLTPFGGVLSVPERALSNMGALRAAGIPCWMAEPLNCSLFPVRSVGSSFTVTVIARDRASNEARVSRTYTIVP